MRPSVILLDDVFSAVDRRTKSHIVKSLFGREGLLRRPGTTIVDIKQEGE
jgi:ATP-binding cassette subfamily C (CFTR/MRP) protein 1